MKQAGQIVLFRFPQTDLEDGKLRPALLVGKLPGEYDDWLRGARLTAVHGSPSLFWFGAAGQSCSGEAVALRASCGLAQGGGG